MQVKEIMSADVAACRPDTNLAEVGKIMWDHDCGFVPVIDASGRLCGVVTDRDICIATATRGRAPQKMSAAQAMHAAPIQTAKATDTIETALATMKQTQVRRLPVLTDAGTLAGIVSMNDIALASSRQGGPDAAEIVIDTSRAEADACTQAIVDELKRKGYL